MTIEPTDEQQAIMIFDPGRPLRVAAGAGTGKTSTIAMRLETLISAGRVEPESTLGITFTVKAAEELDHRLRTRLPELAGAGRTPVVSTYHGFAFSIVREFGGYLGLQQDPRVITPGFGRQLLLETLGEGSYESLDLTHPRGRIEELVALGGELANHLYRPEDLPEPDGIDDVSGRRAELGEVLRRYQLKKRALGAVDFGDMISIAHEIVTTIDRVRAELRRRHRLVLLDEYQDTNAAQRRLLLALFGEGHSVTAVGDTGQTIYEWRGATTHNFNAFPTDFADEDGRPATTLALTANYRSGQAILDLANHIRRRTGEGDAHGLRAHPENPPAAISTAWFHNAVDEANWIAQEVQRLREEAEISRRDGSPIRWRDIAVLFRKNAQIDLVRQALEAEGIPVEVASIGALVHVPEVAQLHAWLQLLERGDLDGPILRILLGPRFRLGIGEIAQLVGWRRHEASTHLLDAIEAVASGAGEAPPVEEGIAPRLERFWEEYRELLVVAQGLTLGDLCRRILDTTSAWIEIESMPDAARLSARLNVYRFLDLAEQWSPLEGRPSVGAFLDYLDSLLDETAADEMEAAQVSSEDAVALLTVHRAKGLEWEAVFLPALAAGVFPSQARGANPARSPGILPRSMQPDDDGSLDTDTLVTRRHERQEWRTAYVAVTRAKQRLIATGAFFYSFVVPKRPSELFEMINSVPDVLERRPVGPAPSRGEGPAALTIDTTPAPDPDFLAGWRMELTKHLDETHGAPAEPDAASSRHLAEQQAVLFELPQPAPPAPAPEPTQVSVTGLVTYASCPRRFFWSQVERLPRRPSRRARAGTQLHRRIELYNLGKVPLAEDLEYDAMEPATTGRFGAFKNSRLGADRPLLVEAPFNYRTERGAVRGRVDAVYGDETQWEIVDFKSGKPRVPGSEMIQLQAYALAARAGGLGRPAPARIDVTFAYLGEGFATHTEEADEEWMAGAAATVADTLGRIDNRDFDPRPSAACHGCDFLTVCEAGTDYVSRAGQ